STSGHQAVELRQRGVAPFEFLYRGPPRTVRRAWRAQCHPGYRAHGERHLLCRRFPAGFVELPRRRAVQGSDPSQDVRDVSAAGRLRPERRTPERIRVPLSGELHREECRDRAVAGPQSRRVWDTSRVQRHGYGAADRSLDVLRAQAHIARPSAEQTLFSRSEGASPGESRRVQRAEQQLNRAGQQQLRRALAPTPGRYRQSGNCGWPSRPTRRQVGILIRGWSMRERSSVITRRATTSVAIVAVATVWLSPIIGAGQAKKPRADAAPTARTKWVAPRTPWGSPDLQGIWTPSTTTPMERPKEFGTREF